MDLPSDRLVRADLLAVRRVLTPNGFTIRLNETPDGRHADYAAAISLGLMKCVVPPVVPVGADPDERITAVWEADRHREAALAGEPEPPGPFAEIPFTSFDRRTGGLGWPYDV